MEVENCREKYDRMNRATSKRKLRFLLAIDDARKMARVGKAGTRNLAG